MAVRCTSHPRTSIRPSRRPSVEHERGSGWTRPDGGGMDDRLTRRQILVMLGGAALGTVLAACSSKKPSSVAAAPGSIDALVGSSGALSMLGPTTPINPGQQPFAFFMVEGQSVIAGASPSVWYAKNAAEQATGPVAVHWYPMDGYSR